MNILLFLAWKSVPYAGHRSAWAIVVAGLFLFTHRLRKEAEEELKYASKKLQAQTFVDAGVTVTEEPVI